MTMAQLALLVVALPLMGFFVNLVTGRSLHERTLGGISTFAVGASFAAAVALYAQLLHQGSREMVVHLFTWISVGTFHVNANLLVDPLSVTMILFVTGISTLIHLYSIGYMHGERDFRKFFLYLNLFVFSMLILVLAANLLLTFVGWEGVGVCSYWLVSYYFEKDSAASAGKKAFIYNRVGDLGLLAAMFMIFHHIGSLDYLTIFSHVSALAPFGTTALLITLALLLAATGKSAQIPLFNWLPDAMEGPTPVSALIHAATMVTAGVYLLVRMSPVINLNATGPHVIAIVGATTAFVAATVACAQRDIKKVLAFSTVSQIGYMVMAVGIGAYAAAIFLMVAHAFFKALLFLGSGSVIHSLHGEQDMRRMGALRRFLPLTFPTFVIGWLAIAGVPPLAGFWAKGDIITNLFTHNKVLWVAALVTAILTAYYMTRLFVMTFTGQERFRDVTHGDDPHESPWMMTLPLVVLSLLTVVGGAIDLPWVHRLSLANFLTPALGPVTPVAELSTKTQWILGSTDAAVAVVGILVATRLWRGRTSSSTLEPSFLAHVWRWDDLYDATIGRPLTALSRFLSTAVDEEIIDGTVRTVTSRTIASSEGLRRIQTGFVRHYGAVMTVSTAILLVYVVARVW
jgi:NADH-quinone oxidoreductase subunit L